MVSAWKAAKITALLVVPMLGGIGVCGGLIWLYLYLPVLGAVANLALVFLVVWGLVLLLGDGDG